MYCTSLKSFIHVHHMISKRMSGALKGMREGRELREKMEERF